MFFFLRIRRPPRSTRTDTLFPYTTLFKGAVLRFAVPLPETTALDGPHLFVATRDLADYAAPQGFSRNGTNLVIETRAKGAAAGPVDALLQRSEERRVGTECGSPCRSRWSRYP